MDIFLIIIGIIGTVTAVMMAVTVYFSNTNFILKMVTLPLIIILMVAIGYYINKELGRPVNYKPEKFELVYFEVTDGGESIVFWSNDENGARLYRIPYDRDTAKKMQEAMEEKEQTQGLKVKGEFKGEGQNGEQTFTYETEFEDSSQNYTK